MAGACRLSKATKKRSGASYGRTMARNSLKRRLCPGVRLNGALESMDRQVTSAWYFILQLSGVTPAHLEKMANAVRNLATFEGKQCVAVATFSDSLVQRAQCSALKSEVNSVLREIQSTSPMKQRTALYKSVRDAILRLDAVQADRKAVVILSNGANEDDTVSEASVIELAREKNVVLFGLAFGDKSVGRPQNVWRLAEKTFGVGRDFSDQSSKDPSEFASNFADLLENGFVLKLRGRDLPSDAELTLSGRLRDNTLLTAGPIEVRRITEDTLLDRVRRTLLGNSDKLKMSAAAVTLILGLLLIGATLWARRRAVPAAAAVQTIGSPAPLVDKPTLDTGGDTNDANDRHEPSTVYGWLEFLDASSTQVPVTATSLRIGRHPDNDVCLPNKSVHRQHAVLHKTGDGAFVIRDLGTKNGVVVNGKRCGQHNLADNDLIELGEVRLRFVANTDLGRSAKR